MKSPLPILACVTALLLGAVVLVLLVDSPVEEGDARRVPAETSRSDAPSAGEAESPDRAGGGREGASDTPDAQAVRTATGVRVRVLRPDGDPAVGIRVQYQGIQASDEWVAEAMADPLTIPTRSVRGNEAEPTDARGVTHIPLEGLGLAGLDRGPWIGAAVIDGSVEGYEATVQLREVDGVDVHVLRADGSPAPDRKVILATRKKPGIDEVASKRWSMNWRDSFEATTDAEGHAWMRTEFDRFSAYDRQRDPADPDTLTAVSVELHGRNRRASTVFDPALADVVEVHLPPMGGMRIVWDGFPQGVRPQLMVGPASSWDRGIVPPARVENGVFVFEGIEIGRRCEASPFRVYESEGREHARDAGAALGTYVVSGPERDAQVVEHRVVFDPPDSIHGRLCRADGEPFVPGEQNGVRSKAFAPSGERQGYGMVSTLLEDGQFFARPWDGPDGAVPLDVIQSLFIEYRPDWDRRPRDGVVRPCWAEVPVSIPAGASSFDLGEVRLTTTEPLLRVRVLDPNDEPLRGVQVAVERPDDSERGQRQGGWSRFDRMSRGQSTDATGEYWIVDKSFESEFLFPRLPNPSTPGGSVDRMRLELTHRDWLPQTVEFGPDRREIVVHMQGGGNLKGSTRGNGVLHEVLVWAVPSGGGERVYGDTLRIYGNADRTYPVEFEALAAGSWDVEFVLADSDGLVVRRIAGLKVEAGQEIAPPPLQDVDLLADIDVIRVRLLRPDGAPLAENDTHGVLHRLHGEHMRKWGRFQVADGVVPIPIERGSRFDGRIVLQDYALVELNDLGAGEITRELREPYRVRLRATGLPNDDRWRVMLQSGRDRDLWTHDVGREGQVFEFQVAAPGTYRLSWQSGELSGGTRAGANGELELTQEALEADQVLSVEAPANFAAAVRDGR